MEGATGLKLSQKLEVIPIERNRREELSKPKHTTDLPLSGNVASLLLRTLRLFPHTLLIGIGHGIYNQKVIFPPVSTVGISQFDYPNSASSPSCIFPTSHDLFHLTPSYLPGKNDYLSDRTSALALQERFINETRVDVVGRLMDVLEKATGLPVRIAQESERKYFAGLLRFVDNTVQIHADFAPHVRSPLRWELTFGLQ